MTNSSRPVDGVALAVLIALLVVGSASVLGGGGVVALFSDTEASSGAIQAGTGPAVRVTVGVNDGGEGNAVLKVRWSASDSGTILGGMLSVTDGDGNFSQSYQLNASEARSGKQTVTVHENGSYTVRVEVRNEDYPNHDSRTVTVRITDKRQDQDTQTSETTPESETGTTTTTPSDKSTKEGTETPTETGTPTEVSTETKTPTPASTSTATETSNSTATSTSTAADTDGGDGA